MKRTLSLVLALIMVLGTFSAVFAADVDEAADFLESVGVLLGNDDGDLMLEDNLARRDAVVLLSRLLGVSDEAAEFEYTDESPSWPDVRTDAYYLPYLAWAEVNEYFQGDDEGKFNPRNPITAQEFAVVLLRALGYADVEWADVMDKANELELFAGLEVEGKDAVVRGQMAVMILNALKAEDGRLAEELDIELPKPAALEVEDVIADNLKEVEVVFNQEVDADTVKDANIKIKNNAGKVSLKDDGVTAVITLDTRLANQKEYTLVVEKVKSADGVEIVKQELKFKTFDAELPEVVGIEVTGPRNLVLTFSEPVEKADGKVTIKQDKVTLGNNAVAPGTNKVTVNAYSNFVEGKEYEVTVEGFKDFAGYTNIMEVLTFTYEKDETPPVATIDKVEQTYVVVSFNKPVKGLKADDFYHTFTAWTALEIYKDADFKVENKVSSTEAVDKVYVQFYKDGKQVGDKERAIPAGSTIFGINGKNIKDNWGNALGNVEFTINATADRVAPEVVSIEVKEDNKLKITFSKEVKFERKNIEILDENGKRISGLYLSGFSAEPAKEFTISYNKDLTGKTVTVSIKDVEDTSLFKNVLTLYKEVLEIKDTVRPEVTAAYFEKNPEEDDEYSVTIYVQFSEAVDAETALNIKNYSLLLGTKVHILDGNAEFDVLNSRVKLTLTESKAKDVHSGLVAGKILQIINVEDLAGNVIVPELNEIGKLETAKDVKYSLKATAKDQLEVEFTDLISNLKSGDFKILIDGDPYSDFTLTQEDSDTATKLIFNLKDEKIDADAGNLEFAVEGTTIKNSYGIDGLTFIADPVEIEDGIKPAYVDKSISIDGKFITLTFDEKLSVTNVPNVIGVDGVGTDNKSLVVASIAAGEGDNANELIIELKVAVEDGTFVRVFLNEELNDQAEAIADESGNTVEEFNEEIKYEPEAEPEV